MGEINGVAVSTANSYQNRPVVVSDAGGGAVIVWNDRRDYSSTGWDIYAANVFDGGLVFADGFESGDTTEWTSVVP